ncbi:MAG: thiamine phosphate synthase [Bacteroidales bacterium]|nr:thiamine phosphate synthase [Candidatus Liminaster caballi]
MIQFITHYTQTIGYLDSVKIALEGGCKWVQLRMKNATEDEIRPLALEAQRLCKEAGATFIIDDHVMLVKEIGADGVHLGKNDMPIDEARRILGKDYIIGGTANTFEDVVMHYRNGADYIGCGPFRFTTTKEKLSPVLGIEGYETIVRKMREADIQLPIVAIGGINREDIPDLIKTGITGIALSGTVLRSDNPVEEMRNLIKLLKI